MNFDLNNPTCFLTFNTACESMASRLGGFATVDILTCTVMAAAGSSRVSAAILRLCSLNGSRLKSDADGAVLVLDIYSRKQ